MQLNKIGNFDSGHNHLKSDNRHILIADDDLTTRMFLKIRLKEANFKVTEVRTGVEAWQAISTKGISLVIMEMKLHEMHGSDLLKKIKKLNPKLPVIIYTSHEEFSGDMTVMTFPHHAYLIKPTPIETILSTVNELISKVE